MMKKLMSVLLLGSLLILFAGCGGGGGDESNSKPSPSTSTKGITQFALNDVEGTIDETAKEIKVVMPAGTSLSSLVASFIIPEGTELIVGEQGQLSGLMFHDFTDPVIYSLILENGTMKNYTVTATVDGSSEEPSAAKAITSFALNGVNGTINQAAKTITVVMPLGTSFTSLVATFTTTGTEVEVGSVVQTSGVTSNNFTNPVTYTVTAQDASTQNYTVTVTVDSSSAKAITSFSLAGVSGAINETAKTIAVTLPNGTALTNLAATFTTTGASVKVGAVVQASGQTPNDFISPVVYTVTAADSSTQDYIVTVTRETERQKATAITVIMKANNPSYVDNGDPEVFCTRTTSIKAYHTVTPNDGRTVIYWQFLINGQVVKEGTATLAELLKTPPELSNNGLFTTGSRITYKATADGAVSHSDNASIT
ncbi:MAG: hypothetical protein WBN66_03490 [Smithella sp.]